MVLTRFKKARRMVEKVFQFNNNCGGGGIGSGGGDEYFEGTHALGVEEEEEEEADDVNSSNNNINQYERIRRGARRRHCVSNLSRSIPQRALRELVHHFEREYFKRKRASSSSSSSSKANHVDFVHSAIPKRYLKKTFDKTCPSEWLFDCLTKNNNISLAVCQAVYLEPLSAIEDFEREKKGFATFPRLPSGGRFPLGSRPPASRHRRELLAMKDGNRTDVSLMSGAWTGARRE